MNIKVTLFCLVWAISYNLSAQQYTQYIHLADSFYTAKDFKQSVINFEKAFTLEKKNATHLYNGACSAALLHQSEKAFDWLEAAITSGYNNIDHLSKDSDLESLHSDARWVNVVNQLQKKLEEMEAKIDKPLRDTLLRVYDDDQTYRHMLDSVTKSFGRNSPELNALWEVIRIKDSVNQKIVTDILDRRGWVGPDQVGPRANQALFLVIQHSNLPTWEKFLPAMRQAVKDGNAKASSLALLEDRTALAQGKKQRYGSQIGRDAATGKHIVSPLEDPDKVDEYRASMGLGPLADYVKRWSIIWDAEAYKKEQASKKQ